MRDKPTNTAAMLVATIAIAGAASATQGEYYQGAQPMAVLFPVDQVVTGGIGWKHPEKTRKPTSRDNRQRTDTQGAR
jgi:hypothetical protein